MKAFGLSFVKLLLILFLGLLTGTAAVSDYDLVTSLGTVTGFTNVLKESTYYTFLGIPYAQPPVGDLRFSKPQSFGPFGCHNGAKFGNNCPAASLTDPSSISGDEDCLILNIQTKLNTHNKRPVMVWIHGGGYYSGSANDQLGDVFVAERDIVFVAINYRIGYLGFALSSSDKIPANLGLWDQHLALQWVRDNIEEYGGDRNSITIFGESAGAGSAIAQMLSSHNDRSLFQRVIVQSAPFPVSKFVVPGLVPFSTFASLMGCNDSSESEKLNCLRVLSPASFINAAQLPTSPSVVIRFDDDFFSRNVVEDITAALDDITGQTKPSALQTFGQYDLILGVNSDEGVNLVTLQGTQLKPDVFLGIPTEQMKAFFSNFYLPNIRSTAHRDLIVDAIIAGYRQDIPLIRRSQLRETQRTLDEINLEVFKQFTGDMLFGLPAIQLLRLHHLMNESTSTYSYEYDHRRSWPDLWPTLDWLRTGADHFDEVPLLFGADKLQAVVLSGSPTSDLTKFIAFNNYTTPEKMLSDLFLDYWTSFAEFGAPDTTAENREWPEFDESETYAQIRTHFNVLRQRRRQSTTNLLAALDKAERQSKPQTVTEPTCNSA